MTEPSAAPRAADDSKSGVRRLVFGAILPGFNGLSLPPWLQAALREGLGGVAYFRQNIDFSAPAQLSALSAEIRSLNPDAIVALDEEGGDVSRLQSLTGSRIPGALVLGELDDEALTESAGRAIGGLCRAAGVNLTFAPVADVNTNPGNPVIGVRSFGASTATVARHTAAAVRGIQSTGVGACAKHFPGHGDTLTDSHVTLPRVALSLTELEAAHLPPFRAAIAAGVQAMMTAHIVVPELGDLPATLNPAAGTLLRGLGFEGMLITDALDMAAIRSTVGSGAGAVQALLAGADLLCVGNPANVGYTDPSVGVDEADFREVLDALLAAVDDGSLPLSILQRAAERRRVFGQWSRTNGADGGSDTLSSTARNETVDWVAAAQRACTVTLPAVPSTASVRLPPTVRLILVVDGRGAPNMAAGLTSDFVAAALRDQWPDARVLSLPAEALNATNPAATHPTATTECILVVNSLADGSFGRTCAESVLAIFPDAICLHVGVPNASEPPLPTINTFGYSAVSARAAIRLLAGSD